MIFEKAALDVEAQFLHLDLTIQHEIGCYSAVEKPTFKPGVIALKSQPL